MAGKQLEAIAHLFYTAKKGGIDLKQGEFDPFGIKYSVSGNHKVNTLALVRVSRATIPGVGGISWGCYIEADPGEGLHAENYKGVRRNCNVGVLVARKHFELLELSHIAETNPNALITTHYAVPAVYDPTVSMSRADFAPAA